MKIHEILPKQSVGDVLFELSVESLLALGYYEDTADFDDVINWHTYTKQDGLECYVKDGAIVCIACFSNCYFQGTNLIGKSPEELTVLLGQPDEIGDGVWVEEDRQQVPYEYFSLGLQIWMDAERVVSVFCNATY